MYQNFAMYINNQTLITCILDPTQGSDMKLFARRLKAFWLKLTGGRIKDDPWWDSPYKDAGGDDKT